MFFPENTLLAAATLGNKPINEDACITLVHEAAGFNAVIVADGLGSYTHAEHASAFAVNWMKKKLEQLDDVQAIDFQEFFVLLKHALVKYADEFENDNEVVLDRYSSMGTTLICAVETADEYIFGYVGNGAIWHIKANFNDFSAARLLPWNASNYLNPHTIEEGGREALFKLVSPSDNFEEISPVVIRLSKDKSFGDWLMICSDGVFSQDQLRVGKNSTGIWMKVEDSMVNFYKMMNDFFEEMYAKEQPTEISTADPAKISVSETTRVPDNATENTLLEQFLQTYLKNGTWDDDATLAVLIPQITLTYQQDKFQVSKLKKE
ncbi:MAG: protein phosphatase 2C domain-containing protein [Verrucomicrobia bacterium]|nr:protein phosphatase 2C domain-containing protein [Cytophagales bacterium]